MKKILSIIVIYAAFLWTALAQGTDTSQTMQEMYLNTFTITGTRTPKTLNNTPVVTRVISAKEIEKLDATDIKDVLLSELPGVEFSYSMNQQVSMRLQGLGGMSVLFLIDGERLAGETLDNIDFQRLNMDNIERIEIVKGAASALYGSNSVGAVVNIITKSKSEPWAAQINTRFGSKHNEQRHGGNLSFRQGKFTNLFNAQYDTQDSYRVYDEGKTDSSLVFGTYQWNLKDKLIYKINNNHEIIAKGGFYFHERNSSIQQKDRARDYAGGIRYRGRLNDDNSLEIGYTADRYDKSDFYPEIKKEYIDYQNTQHSLRALFTHTFSDDLSLIVGGDGMYDYLMSYQFIESDNSHDQYTSDFFAQADYNIGKHWNLIGGVRADYFSKYGWELSPKLAAMYKLEKLKFRGSYSKGFRAPTLKEMYMNFNMGNVFNIYGNEDLQAEKTNSFCLSAEYLQKYYCITVTGFYNILDNEISTVWDSTLSSQSGTNGAMRYINVEGTDLASVDVSFAANYPNGINLKLNYGYFHEFPHNDAPNTSDSRPHTLTAQIGYHKGWKNYQFDVILNGRYLSEANFYSVSSSNSGVYDTYSKTFSPAYTLWRLSTLHKFYNCFSITLSIDNLFNYIPKHYDYNSPYTVGTTFSIGAALDIDKFVDIL